MNKVGVRVCAFMFKYIMCEYFTFLKCNVMGKCVCICSYLLLVLCFFNMSSNFNLLISVRCACLLMHNLCMMVFKTKITIITNTQK